MWLVGAQYSPHNYTELQLSTRNRIDNMKLAALSTPIFIVIAAARCIATEDTASVLRGRDLGVGNKHPITDAPTIPNTSIPSAGPSQGPTSAPSNLPTAVPSHGPSPTPTQAPTLSEEPTYSEPPSVGDPSCSANPACAARGLAGDCCPTIENVFLYCCNE